MCVKKNIILIDLRIGYLFLDTLNKLIITYKAIKHYSLLCQNMLYVYGCSKKKC